MMLSVYSVLTSKKHSKRKKYETVFSACITQFVYNKEEFLILIHNGLHTEYQCYQDIFTDL
jgi:hypothetical protein